jgi:hypothetical protein
MSIKCEIACDFCGKKPAHWFGRTSVAICDDPKCIETNNERWTEHVRRIEIDSELEKENRGY